MALRRPRLAQVAVLVDADQARFLFLAEVAGHVGIAHHRDLDAALGERLDRMGHDVVVLHVRDRRVRADHRGDLPRVTTRRVDDDLRDDRPMLGRDFPLAARAPADPGHPVVAQDRDAEVARALRERVADPGRIAMAVVLRPRRRDHPVGRQVRVQALDLVDPDDVHPEADVPRVPEDALQPRELVRVAREPQTAAPVPADVLPGQGLEPGIELIAVGVDLREVVAAGDARALAGGVPGGTGGQLVLLDDDRVGQAFEREVIGEAGTHDAATDDDDLCVCFHAMRRAPDGG
jgi:hypothetical protein